MNNKQFLSVLAVIYIYIFSVHVFAAGESVGKAVAPWGSVELFSDPCVAKKVLKQLDPSMHKDYKRSVTVFQGKTYESCWIVVPESMAHGLYFLIDESGDAAFVSKSEFKRGLGT